MLKNEIYKLSDNELLNILIEEKPILKENQNLSILNQDIDLLSVGEETQTALYAIREISKRLIAPKPNDKLQIAEPQSLVNWLNLEIGYKKQEYFMAVYLDKQNHLLKTKLLFKGTLDRSVVHPREIFKEAVKSSASRIILVHNHPSGSLSPSSSDVNTTEILVAAGQMMGIFILDHLIVSHGNYVSIREKMPHLFILD